MEGALKDIRVILNPDIFSHIRPDELPCAINPEMSGLTERRRILPDRTGEERGRAGRSRSGKRPARPRPAAAAAHQLAPLNHPHEGDEEDEEDEEDEGH